NRTEVYFDVLGRVVAAATRGKGSEADNLVGYDLSFANPSRHQALAFFNPPPAMTEGDARTLFGHALRNATTRFLYHFGEAITDDNVVWGDRPAGACTIVREQHFASLAAGALSPLQISFECLDGVGNVLMKRSQAEPETA